MNHTSIQKTRPYSEKIYNPKFRVYTVLDAESTISPESWVRYPNWPRYLAFTGPNSGVVRTKSKLELTMKLLTLETQNLRFLLAYLDLTSCLERIKRKHVIPSLESTIAQWVVSNYRFQPNCIMYGWQTNCWLRKRQCFLSHLVIAHCSSGNDCCLIWRFFVAF